MNEELVERVGDIWQWYEQGWTVVVTTNGVVKRDGSCVMGRGIAKQVKDKFPRFPYVLGRHLLTYGNVVGWFPDYRLITLPVKHRYDEMADLDLIEESVKDLCRIVNIVHRCGASPNIASVRPGCGNGQLVWEKVRPIVAPWLVDAAITVVNA